MTDVVSSLTLLVVRRKEKVQAARELVDVLTRDDAAPEATTTCGKLSLFFASFHILLIWQPITTLTR